MVCTNGPLRVRPPRKTSGQSRLSPPAPGTTATAEPCGVGKASALQRSRGDGKQQMGFHPLQFPTLDAPCCAIIPQRSSTVQDSHTQPRGELHWNNEKITLPTRRAVAPIAAKFCCRRATVGHSSRSPAYRPRGARRHPSGRTCCLSVTQQTSLSCHASSPLPPSPPHLFVSLVLSAAGSVVRRRLFFIVVYAG